jgi:hypothetical protein
VLYSLEVAAHCSDSAPARFAVATAVQIGRLLKMARNKLTPVEWMRWIKADAPFDGRTARGYMACYENREGLQFETVSDLIECQDSAKGLSQNFEKNLGGEPRPFALNNGEAASALVDTQATHRENPAWFPDLPMIWLPILQQGDMVLLASAKGNPFAVEIHSRQGDTFQGRSLDGDDEQSFHACNIMAILYCPRQWVQKRR